MTLQKAENERGCSSCVTIDSLRERCGLDLAFMACRLDEIFVVELQQVKLIIDIDTRRFYLWITRFYPKSPDRLPKS